MAETEVLVWAVDAAGGREIGSGGDVLEKLKDRVGDVHSAIVAGVDAVVRGIDGVQAPQGWGATEVSASFGITLTAESGVVLAKAGGGASFEVTVTLRRQ